MSEKNQSIPTDTGVKSATGAIALADGSVFLGTGTGFIGSAIGELCFNTAMTGYQEILTDPSYAEQVILFTFPHIGNVGTNAEDHEESSENAAKAAVGTVFRDPITPPSNWRATDHFDAWLSKKGIVGVSGVDTRALTRKIRTQGMQSCAMAHNPSGNIDLDALIAQAKAWKGLEGADLADQVATEEQTSHSEPLWDLTSGFSSEKAAEFHVVVIDFGIKKNILRNLSSAGIRSTVVDGNTALSDVLTFQPDGIVLSNGPGDPAATINRSGDLIRGLIDSGLPILGICLGHQLLALALGAKTLKMDQGHHGANHPVQDLTTGKVEIVSMNHGFTVDTETLPDGVKESHRSLFDGTNSGLEITGKSIISVQHHPEASPGPQDSFYLFERFADLIRKHKA